MISSNFFLIIKSATVIIQIFAFVFLFISSEKSWKWKCNAKNYVMFKILIAAENFPLEKAIGIDHVSRNIVLGLISS